MLSSDNVVWRRNTYIERAIFFRMTKVIAKEKASECVKPERRRRKSFRFHFHDDAAGISRTVRTSAAEKEKKVNAKLNINAIVCAVPVMEPGSCVQINVETTNETEKKNSVLKVSGPVSVGVRRGSVRKPKQVVKSSDSNKLPSFAIFRCCCCLLGWHVVIFAMATTSSFLLNNFWLLLI